jgi:hypothetical protein
MRITLLHSLVISTHTLNFSSCIQGFLSQRILLKKALLVMLNQLGQNFLHEVAIRVTPLKAKSQFLEEQKNNATIFTNSVLKANHVQPSKNLRLSFIII